MRHRQDVLQILDFFAVALGRQRQGGTRSEKFVPTRQTIRVRINTAARVQDFEDHLEPDLEQDWVSYLEVAVSRVRPGGDWDWEIPALDPWAPALDLESLEGFVGGSVSSLSAPKTQPRTRPKPNILNFRFSPFEVRP